jgi:beta-lactamase regulating signal transducer with metallopeptidase domain
MSTLGFELGWLAARATIVALAALALLVVVGRRRSRSVVVVLASAVAILLILPAMAMVPLPQNWNWPVSRDARPPESSAVAQADGRAHTDRAEPVAEQASIFNQLLAGLRQWSGRTSATPAWQWSWNAAVALYGLGLVFLGTRWLFGWRALQALKRRSRPIADVELHQQAGELRAALRCNQVVELRQTDEAGLAATFGWRRPLILLPPEWRGWSDVERRAVLAHELAHVRHRDFLLGLLTSLCGMLHFYHPLVRWLIAQMRWRQEAAADDLAATATGGRSIYLKALAGLALRLPARMPAGAALILPAMTGGTFLRRIHMLRGAEKKPLTPLARGLLVAFLAAIGLLVSAWRGPAQSSSSEAPAAKLEPFELGYLVPHAKGLVAVRPSVWLAQPGMDKAAKKIDEMFADLHKMGIDVPDEFKPSNIEQIVGNLHFATAGTGKPGSRSVMIGTTSIFVRFHKEVDGPGLLRSLIGELKEERKGDCTIYRLGTLPVLGPLPVAMFMPDRRTMVLIADEKEDAAHRQIQEVAATRKRDWGSGWKQLERAPFAVVLDNTDGNYATRYAKDVEDLPEMKSILKDLRFASLGIELGDNRPVRVVLDAKSAEAAKTMEKYGTKLLMDGLAKVREEAKEDDADAVERVWLKLSTELVESRRVHMQGSRVEWLLYSSVRVRDLIDADGMPIGTSAKPGP